MTRIRITALPLLAFALSLDAQVAVAGQHVHHGAAAAPLSEAIVKKVDKPSGKITLSHGPLPNGMPAMTMTYKLKGGAQFDGINEGQKVLFAADETMAIVHLETAK